MSRLKLVAIAVFVLLGSAGGAYALGIVGVPAVESVDNRFTGVSANTTTIESGITVSNPNPVGVPLGETSLNYTVLMNDVEMATGQGEDLAVESGNTTLTFTTEMRNRRIPAWWVSHVRNGEVTQVSVDATVNTSLLGGQSASLSQSRTVDTDIIGQFNSTETRPVEANRPFVSDPVLYINETRGSWDRANVTRSETPMDLSFDVYNPKAYPYTISRIGYDVRMNNLSVGDGETRSGAVITPGETETIRVDTAIRNQLLDQWWVSHLQRNQETELYIDFYLIVEGGNERFRVNLDSIDYETLIETDIFDNKEQYPTGTDASQQNATGESAEPTPTPTPTETGDGVLSGGETETATDDGPIDGGTTATETDDGLVDASL